MNKAKNATYHHLKVLRRFSVAMGRSTTVADLTLGMLAAVVTTMNELSPEEIALIKDRIDQDQVRVFL